jgi:hydrogenase assembly chaperone HypC/HupF
MCVGIPGKVVEIKNKRAKVKQGDHLHWWDLGLIQEKVEVGDYLLSYQEAAINKLTPKQAQETLGLLAGND